MVMNEECVGERGLDAGSDQLNSDLIISALLG